MISDSHFTKLHYDAAITATNNNNKLMYLSRGYSKAHSVKIEPSIHHDYVVHLQATYKHDKLSIIGSCRGFLLLQNDVPEPVLVLCNPAMGSHTIVPYPDNFWNVDFYLSCSFRGGVVYDKFNDDYLVILGSVQVNGNVIIRKPQWKVFSVRTNSWKDIEGGDCFIPIVIHHRQLRLLYNEAIHWLAMYIGPVQRQGFVIVAFDTVTKTLSMIPLPYPQRPPDQMELSLLGGGGCFGICMMNNKIPEIWVMREYKVESSWTKLNIVLPCRNLVPLCFTKSDEVVAKLDGINHLIKCSGERVLEYCGLISCDPHPIVIMFTESLLSLPSSYRQEE